jgi:hypothetical protein
VLGVDRSHFLNESRALLLDVGAVPFGMVQVLLLTRDLQPPQGPPNGHEAARQAQTLTQFSQRRVGLLAEYLLQALLGGRVQGGGPAAAMGLGGEVAGVTAALQQAGDEGQTDAEAAGDVASGAFAVVDRGGDTFTQVQGVRSHSASLIRKQRSPPFHATLRAGQK